MGDIYVYDGNGKVTSRISDKGPTPWLGYCILFVIVMVILSSC